MKRVSVRIWQNVTSMSYELSWKSNHENVTLDAATHCKNFCHSDSAVAVKWTQVALKIDKTHAGCLREAACSANPGRGARGTQADSAFHPKSLSGKKQSHKGGCWHTSQELWPFATCDSFPWKMPLHVTQQACQWIFSDSLGDAGIGRMRLRVSLYFDLSVLGWVHTLIITDLHRTLCHSEVQPG